ncbi:hypothetical protein AAZX31_02G270700 [Glycine max]|uniref:Ribosomal protein L14 n=2 Tax=Glycine subgen. Soja TaxID=1462606 RepID=A0A0R0L8S6_SOYBN|nr:50S ribosomal protein HLP, mitochondrial [Glycine soja]
MAATLTSRCSLLGRSLLGGLRNNNLSGSLTSHEIKSSNFLSQKLCGFSSNITFIQMRTVLKVVDNSGEKKVTCIQALKGKKVKFDDKQGQPIGTRVFGPVPHELRQNNHVKILTLAGHIA